MNSRRHQLVAVVVFLGVIATLNVGPYRQRSDHPRTPSVDRHLAAILDPVPYAGSWRTWAASLAGRLDDHPPRSVAADVLIVGDSLLDDVAGPLTNELDRLGVTSDTLIRRGTALAPQDPWGWENSITSRLRNRPPPAVVVTLLELAPGRRADDMEWVDEAAALVDMFASWFPPDTTIVWLARPVAAGFEITNEAVRRHDRVLFVDATQPFVAVARDFVDSIVVDGRLVDVRQNDGFHLSPPAAVVFADEIVRRLTVLFGW